MPRPIKNVWGVACPKCHAPDGSACRDLRSRTGLLYGRRTHAERAKALKDRPRGWVRGWRNNQAYTTTLTTTTGSTLVTDEMWYHNAATTTGAWTAMPTMTTGTITMNTTTTPYHNTQDTVWPLWVQLQPAHFNPPPNTPVWYQWVEDDEERIARIERERRYHDELQTRREQASRERLAREQELMANRAVANERALVLLDELLNETERDQRRTENEVTLLGSDGCLYRIEMNRETVHGNVVRTDEHGCLLGRACVAPAMYDGFAALPTPDGWVGQYLGLKFDAVTFLSHANWSGVRECSRRAA